MTPEFIKNLQRTHLAIWNEKDASAREKLIKTIYADDIRMFDKDFILTGSAEVSNFISKLLKEDAAFDFTATKEMQATQNGVRFFWNIKTSGPILTGMDFFVIQADKVSDLYVFMD